MNRSYLTYVLSRVSDKKLCCGFTGHSDLANFRWGIFEVGTCDS